MVKDDARMQQDCAVGEKQEAKMPKNDADDYRPIPRFEDAKSPTEQREALAVYENCALTVVPGPTFGRLVDETEVMDQLLAFIQDDNEDDLEADAEDSLRGGPEDVL